jgi:nucleotide-binding universal stress UspA family protein
MTTKPTTIRRILVALDASPHSFAALEAAAHLAAHLEAELFGLYVEDENLLRGADRFPVKCGPSNAGTWSSS